MNNNNNNYEGFFSYHVGSKEIAQSFVNNNIFLTLKSDNFTRTNFHDFIF